MRDKAMRLQQRWGDIGGQQHLVVVVATAACLGVFALFRDLLDVAFDMSFKRPWTMLVPPGAAILFGLVFFGVRYAVMTPLLRVATRSSALGLLVFLLVEPPDFVVADSTQVIAIQFVYSGYWLALGSAVLSTFRPSFVPAVAVYLLGTRFLCDRISGLPVSTLDIQYMLEIALFLGGFSVLLVGLAAKWMPAFGTTQRQYELAFAAFGLHLGNYFWSAIAKLTAGPHLWSWIVENPTYNSISYALENGILPIGGVPVLVMWADAVVRFLSVPLNAAILGVQLAAVICVFRVGWLKAATLAYDVLHTGIFLLGGLFFWPWVWNNVTILVAVRKRVEPIGRGAKLACLTVILLGHPGLSLVSSAWLAWFDITDARQTYFEAVLDDASTAKVPSSFFLGSSHSVGHAQMGRVPIAGQFPFLWSASATYERFIESGACSPPGAGFEPNEPAAERDKRLKVVGDFLRANHARMLDFYATWGRWAIYARSHHLPSNPFLYEAFNRIDLSRVVGYNLVAQSICHHLKDGRLDNRVLATQKEYFDVTE